MAEQRTERTQKMPTTLLLVSSLKNACVEGDLQSTLKKALKVENSRVLYHDVAFEIDLPVSAHPQEAKETAQDIIENRPIDCVLQNSENRRKKLFLADMDSTIIGQECIDELAAEIGVKDRVSRITEAAMNGEIDFEDALKERVALLGGLEEAIVEKVLRERITINEGAKQALAVMKANRTHTALVSGGFTVFAGEIARAVGFHEYHANRLLSENGKFTGKVEMPILGQQAKLDQLNRLIRDKGIKPGETIAIGDGANDLPMLMNAGTGIAFHAKPSVAAQAEVVIDHGDLSALLFVQGYTEADINNCH